MRRILVASALPCTLLAQIKILVHLSPATNQAFDKYVAAAESKMDGKPLKPAGGLSAVGGSPIDVEGGMIHDWAGGVMVKELRSRRLWPCSRTTRITRRPSRRRCSIRSCCRRMATAGTRGLRISRRNVFTVTFDTEYAVQYRKLEGGRWAIDSRSRQGDQGARRR